MSPPYTSLRPGSSRTSGVNDAGGNRQAVNTTFADGHAEFFAFSHQYEANAVNAQQTPDPSTGLW